MGALKKTFSDTKNLYASEKLIQPEEMWPNDVFRALKCLNENLFDKGFTVAKMRKVCIIPQKNFSSRFNYYVGFTPVSYLKYHRIQCSKQIIHQLNDNFSMSYLAFEVGYEYPSTFSSAFKNIVGHSPKEYLNFSKNK